MRTVVLTRPRPEALQWQRLLGDAGLSTTVLPLIDIAPLHDSPTQAALAAACARLGQYRALMFVSSNAVRHFLAAPGMQAAADQALHTGTRAWAPGPGTHQVLLQAGLSADQVDSPAAGAGQFDSESLWAVVGPQIRPGDRVLIVRGASQDAPGGPQGSGREWLAQQLRSQGASVDLLGVYARQCPAATPGLTAAIEASCQAASLWLFSSSEAIAHLRQIMPQHHWESQRALTTHPRIAAAARAAGFGEVRECKPDVMDVRASIESWP